MTKPLKNLVVLMNTREILYEVANKAFAECRLKEPFAPIENSIRASIDAVLTKIWND